MTSGYYLIVSVSPRASEIFNRLDPRAQQVDLNIVMSGSESSIPEWAIGLKRVGNYFEGYVEDIEAVRQKHQASTVSTYGCR